MMMSMSFTPSVQNTSEEWQRRFFLGNIGGDRSRGYYKAIETGKLYGPIDSNEPLPDTLTLVLFNRICPPGERAINDWLARKESALLSAVDRVILNHVMTVEDKIDIARLLALHASQYPDLFGHPINLDRYYATVLHDEDIFSNHVAFNAHLRWSGFPPNTCLEVAEFKKLCAVPNNERDLTVDLILQARGYEPVFDKRLLLLGEFPSAGRLLEFEWELIEAPQDEFVFSDRPIPSRLATGTIALGISARFGIRLTQPETTNDVRSLTARAAKHWEVAAINAEVRQRAEKWVCGPDPRYL
jgi:hypothetical protein